MFVLFCFLLAGICIWRGIMPLHWPRWCKITLSILVAVLAFNFILRRLAGVENLPVWWMLTIAWGFSLLALYDGMLIIYESVYWMIWGIGKGMHREFPLLRKCNWLRSWLLLPAGVIVCVGMVSALGMPQVHEYELFLPRLPIGSDGMTVVLLTDIHADKITDRNRIERIVEKVNSLNPDLIAVGGDIVDRRVDLLSDELMPLGKLRAKYGVYGVPGNHEYYAGYSRWIAFFNSIGIKMLENSHVILPGSPIVLAGTTDPAAEKMDMELPDVAKSFAGVPENAFKILLTHQPKVVDQSAAAQVDLQLSGHTHGGMVRGMDLLIACFNKGMVSGEYDYDNVKVFISNGAGIWSGFPVRLGRSSEIVLLRLRCKK